MDGVDGVDGMDGMDEIRRSMAIARVKYRLDKSPDRTDRATVSLRPNRNRYRRYDRYENIEPIRV